MDYGHPLRFGVFLTPSAAEPSAVVGRARLAEDLGLDLVTFQDHPYQSAFLDTWTLLAWVAGATERIALAANVHNVPMRPPAVLARAAASLDLLSGGRVELGLGAGAFWDAMEAMGVERLTPGESVTAMGASRARLDSVWDELHRHALGLYLSFETDPRPERLLDAFPPATLARLRALKSAVDPTGLFRDNSPLFP